MAQATVAMVATAGSQVAGMDLVAGTQVVVPVVPVLLHPTEAMVVRGPTVRSS